MSRGIHIVNSILYVPYYILLYYIVRENIGKTRAKQNKRRRHSCAAAEYYLRTYTAAVAETYRFSVSKTTDYRVYNTSNLYI